MKRSLSFLTIFMMRVKAIHQPEWRPFLHPHSTLATLYSLSVTSTDTSKIPNLRNHWSLVQVVLVVIPRHHLLKRRWCVWRTVIFRLWRWSLFLFLLMVLTMKITSLEMPVYLLYSLKKIAWIPLFNVIVHEFFSNMKCISVCIYNTQVNLQCEFKPLLPPRFAALQHVSSFCFPQPYKH